MWPFTSAWDAVSETPRRLLMLAYVWAVYSNSVLATLNARKSIRGLGEDTDELSFSLESFTKSGSKPLTSSVGFLWSYFQPLYLMLDVAAYEYFN